MKTLLIKLKATQFWKTHKQEATAIPILVLGLYILSLLLSWLSPNSALFDFASYIETLAYRGVSFIVTIAIAWYALKIFFPPIHNRLDYMYHNFDKLPSMLQNIIAIGMFAIFMLAGSFGARAETNETRNKLIQLLDTQTGVRETSPNRGIEVDAYLLSVGTRPPAPWCGAFVGYNLTKLGITNPNSAWSPNYAQPKDIIWTYPRPTTKPLPGDVVTFYFQSLGRVGHVGFYLKTDPDGYFITIEGNTGAGILNREGDGVYKRKRSQYQIHAISRYIK